MEQEGAAADTHLTDVGRDAGRGSRGRPALLEPRGLLSRLAPPAPARPCPTRARQAPCARACVRENMRVLHGACVHACVQLRVCVCVCVCACACVGKGREGGGERGRERENKNSMGKVNVRVRARGWGGGGGGV